MIRAIDVEGDQALVGCRDGTIYQVTLSSEEKITIMNSHSDGEVWGLAVIDKETIITSGDDNKICVWNVELKSCTS